MVTVAKSFDAPIKLLWPRDLFTTAQQFSMLGLGDIILPGNLIKFIYFFSADDKQKGIFVALLLRFDARRAKSINPKAVMTGNFSKPYFTFTFGGYVIGLVTTIVVMHYFQAA